VLEQINVKRGFQRGWARSKKSWRRVDLKRKGIWALIIVVFMITLVFFGYHINKWSQLKEWEGDFVSDVEWKPDGSYALVVGGYVKRVESPDIEFVKSSDTPSSSWEIHEIHYKIWRYSGDALTELMSWNDEEYDYPKRISWAPNGSYALIWTDNGIYKYDDVQNTLTLVTSENDRDIECFWWPESSNVLFFDTEFERGPFLAFYDGNSINTFDTTGLRLWEVAPAPSGASALTCGRNSRNDTRLIMEFTGSEFEIIWCNESHEVENIVWSSTGEYALMVAQTYKMSPTKHLFKYDGMNVAPLLDYENKITSPRDIRSISRRPGTDEFYILCDGLVRVLINDTIVREIEYSDNYETEFIWEPQGNSAFLVGLSSKQFFDGENITTLPINLGYYGESVLWEPNGKYAVLFGHDYDTSSFQIWKYYNGAVTLVYDNVRIDYFGTGTFKPDGSKYLAPVDTDKRDGCLMEYDGNNVDFIINGVAEEDAVTLRFWALYVVTISVILILLILKWKYGLSDEAEGDSLGDEDISGDMTTHGKIHDESVNRYMMLVWKINHDKNKKLHVVCPSCGVSADFSVTVKGNLTRFLCENCFAQYTLDG
jgi:hypothetical protein